VPSRRLLLLRRANAVLGADAMLPRPSDTVLRPSDTLLPVPRPMLWATVLRAAGVRTTNPVLAGAG